MKFLYAVWNCLLGKVTSDRPAKEITTLNNNTFTVIESQFGCIEAYIAIVIMYCFGINIYL